MPPPAPVPYSQLKDYKYYIVPTPSDEARFLTATYATNADEYVKEYVKEQRRLLLEHVGRRMHLLGNRHGAWNTQLNLDNGKNKTVYFDETSFPPGQLFQEVGLGLNPALPVKLTDVLTEGDIAAQFYSSRKYDVSVKLTDVLSQADIAAQEQFYSSLSLDEKRGLSQYKGDGYMFMGPLMRGMVQQSRGVVRYAIKETRANSKDPARPPLPKERPGPGFIREFMAGFLSFISRAPRLTKEINVFRGVVSKGGLNIDGTMAISTSYDKHVAAAYSNEREGCCMLKINVKPGVRIFAWDQSDAEKEIMVLPPYKAQIEDVGGPESGIKKVTITPVKYRGGTRRRRKTLRQSKKLTSKFRANKHKSSRNKRDR